MAVGVDRVCIEDPSHEEAEALAVATCAPVWAVFARIPDWASLPEALQQARSAYFQATTGPEKQAARVALWAAQAEAAQGVGAVTVGSGVVTSRTRLCEVETSPPRESGPRGVGRGMQAQATQHRKVNRVPEDTTTARVTEGLDELEVL